MRGSGAWWWEPSQGVLRGSRRSILNPDPNHGALSRRCRRPRLDPNVRHRRQRHAPRGDGRGAQARGPDFHPEAGIGNSRSGTVFVRKPGRTVPADASDMDALQARLMAARPPTALEIGLTGDVPISWFEGETTSASLRAWVTERAESMVAAARETEAQRLAPKPTPTFRAVGSLAEMVGDIPTRRPP